MKIEIDKEIKRRIGVDTDGGINSSMEEDRDRHRDIQRKKNRDGDEIYI